MTGRLAVMQDDTVLCADCVHEYQTEGLPETPATLVYAWLADPADAHSTRARRRDMSLLRRQRYRREAGVMNGQGVIGRDCAWCGLPAVSEVAVQPAQYRTIAKADPVIGDRSA